MSKDKKKQQKKAMHTAHLTTEDLDKQGKTKINRKELAICKRRGHDDRMTLHQGWVQCKWCNIWLREVRTLEEREDEPPMDEINSLLKMKRRLNEGKV
jgi:hypothetical protein